MLTKQEAKTDALKFLNENTTAVLATSADNIPRAATIYYLVDQDFNFYFLTKDNTGHCQNIRNNPNVALVIGTGPEHITVQVKGHADFLDGKAKDEIVEKFMDMFAKEFIKTRPVADVYRYKDKDTVAVKIEPIELSYLNLDSSTHKESIVDNYMYLIP